MKPKSSGPAWEYVQSMAKIADLAESHYRTTLALSALIELMVDKGFITPEEFHQKAADLEKEDHAFPAAARASLHAEPTSSHSVDLS